MRFLIAAACVAVIAYVGYYFWGEYNRSHAESQLKDYEVKTRQDFINACNRITTNDPQYDEAYSASLSKTERTTLADKCIEFDRTGIIPEKSAP